ncbi:MAG: hypothetical protein KH242_02055 [Varibaculum cambriense]|uniref:hypothetical protein n=1 Tax=Varibaculum cambriense TaxID=184870 RepID=UPI0003F9948D|nr:hypothetical protein [Varibaculum cambriense]MBS6753331.1 hypothetical protein [Varibaculum cambriense]
MQIARGENKPTDPSCCPPEGEGRPLLRGRATIFDTLRIVQPTQASDLELKPTGVGTGDLGQ